LREAIEDALECPEVYEPGDGSRHALVAGLTPQEARAALEHAFRSIPWGAVLYNAGQWVADTLTEHFRRDRDPAAERARYVDVKGSTFDIPAAWGPGPWGIIARVRGEPYTSHLDLWEQTLDACHTEAHDLIEYLGLWAYVQRAFADLKATKGATP
jgi:hypothetical protein